MKEFSREFFSGCTSNIQVVGLSNIPLSGRAGMWYIQKQYHVDGNAEMDKK